MTINFNGIPADTRTPGAFLEVDPSQALKGLTPWHQKVLVIGQKSSTGTATAATLYPLFSDADGDKLSGAGSIGARMIRAARKVNKNMELWGIFCGDGTTAGAWTVDFGANPATEAGMISCLIGGQRVQVGVANGNTAAEVAANFKAKCDELTNLPVTATVLTAVVTLTHKCPGAVGGDLDIRMNYYDGEKTPAGLSAPVITNTVIGAGNPDLEDAGADIIAALGDQQFDYILNPYNDDSNLGKLEAELERRFNPMVQIPSVAFTAFKGTNTASATAGKAAGRNSPHVVFIPYNDAPTPTEEWGAAVGLEAAFNGNIDPARPFQRLPVPGLLPPKPGSTSRWTREERNVLLWSGCSTWIPDDGGNVQIERLITMYRTNVSGVPDPAYLDLNTLLTLMYIRYQVRTRILLRFPRHKLVSDQTPVKAGSATVRPKDIKACLIGLFSQLQDAGIIENLDEFVKNLKVEINASDPNRVDALIPCDLVNQFRIFAGLIQYIL